MSRRILFVAVYALFVVAVVFFEVRHRDASLFLHLVRMVWMFVAGYMLALLVRPVSAAPVVRRESDALSAAQDALDVSNHNFERVISMLQDMKARDQK